MLKQCCCFTQVQGDLKTSSNGSRTFHWSSSHARVFPALRDTRYSHEGSYLMFQEFDVELRTRVKCVTTDEGQDFDSRLFQHKNCFESFFLSI